MMTRCLLLAAWAAGMGGELPPNSSPDFATGVAPLATTVAGDPLALVPVPVDPVVAATEAQAAPTAETLVGPDQWGNLPVLLVDHLALDWGVASIPAPLLFPGGAAAGATAGQPPRFPGSAAATSLGAAADDPAAPTPVVQGVQAVPEPGSLIMWGLIAVGIGLRRRGA